MSTPFPYIDSVDLTSVLPFGLYPEESILESTSSKNTPREEVKKMMEEVLNMVSERVEEAWPGHKDLSGKELTTWLQLSTMTMSVEEINDPDFSVDVSCAVLLLYFHWEKYELKDLVRFVKIARFIYTARRYNLSYNYSFTSLLTPIMTRLHSV